MHCDIYLKKLSMLVLTRIPSAISVKFVIHSNSKNSNIQCILAYVDILSSTLQPCTQQQSYTVLNIVLHRWAGNQILHQVMDWEGFPQKLGYTQGEWPFCRRLCHSIFRAERNKRGTGVRLHLAPWDHLNVFRCWAEEERRNFKRARKVRYRG